MSKRTAILFTGLLAQACFYQPEFPADPGALTSTGMMTTGVDATNVGTTAGMTIGEPTTGDAITSATTAAPEPVCGNGALEADEQCDDGNDADDDACVSGCLLATCGDGHVGPGEACDPFANPNCTPDCKPPLCDGATINPELGEECDGANIGACSSKACDYDCTCAYCGDFTISVELAEACDDGDAAAGDGCSADCGLDTEVIDIGVGNTHVCVAFASGAIRCWGANGAVVNGAFVRDFRLGPGSEAIDRRGDGSPDGTMPAPNITVPGKSFAKVDGGEGFSCAIAVEPGDVAGDVYCWGGNSGGQLGVDPADIKSSSEPLLVKGLGGPSFVAVAGGHKHACAIRSDGRVLCWGASANNVLGKTFKDSDKWSPPIEVPMPANITVLQITAGLAHTCALAQEGSKVICWGFADSYGVLGVSLGFGNDGNVAFWSPVNVIAENESVVEIAAGRRHVCALTNKGGVRCWGSNIHGQLGTNNNNGVASFAQPPADVLLGSPSAGLTSGAGHTCARIAGQGAKCWGEGGYGQIGTGTKSGLLAPNNSYVNLKSKNVKMIRAHLGQFSCALFEDLTMSCWGLNSDGQLGYGNTDNVGDDVDEGIAGVMF